MSTRMMLARPLGRFSRLPSPSSSCVARRSISSALLTKDLLDDGNDSPAFLQRPSKEKLVFGTTLTDHMLTIEWERGTQWKAPQIVPYQDLKLSPAASCLHYGLQCFEGMKAYRSLNENDDDSNNSSSTIRLFRPDKNMKRLQNSMDRLHMPGADFDGAELIECIKELVRVDQKWIPTGEGYSLYLRPTVISTHPYLGVAAPDRILLYVILAPVGPYYKSGFQPVRLTADTPYVRAWPGGTGAHKVGGNYGATMKAQWQAAQSGYDQVLWLFGEDDEVTEVGAMNVFFVFRHDDDGVVELVTPPLDRGDILPGVTRDSILHLARSKWKEDVVVRERFPTMREIRDAAEAGTLLEAFGAGTAAVVTPIGSIQYQGADIEIPATGPITQRVWNEITGIQYGTIEGPEGWSVKV